MSAPDKIPLPTSGNPRPLFGWALQWLQEGRARCVVQLADAGQRKSANDAAEIEREIDAIDREIALRRMSGEL